MIYSYLERFGVKKLALISSFVLPLLFAIGCVGGVEVDGYVFGGTEPDTFPLPGAKVQVCYEDDKELLAVTVYTDDTGSFHIYGLCNPWRYDFTMTISKPGYETKVLNFDRRDLTYYEATLKGGPSPPQDVVAILSESGEVVIYAIPVLEGDGYLLYESEDGVNFTATSTVHSTLPYNCIYFETGNSSTDRYYYITSTGSPLGESAPSETVFAQIASKWTPNTFSTIEPPGGAECIDPMPTFKWDKVSDAAGYVIVLKQSSQLIGIVALTSNKWSLYTNWPPTETIYASNSQPYEGIQYFQGLQSMREHQWQVFAVDEAGWAFSCSPISSFQTK